MHAAMKGTTIDAVIYCGVHGDVYPYWFTVDIIDNCHVDVFNQLELTLSDETDDDYESVILVPYESVILRNKYHEIYHIKLDIFNKLYFSMGNHCAALKSDCVEYFNYKRDTTYSQLPGWVTGLVDDEWLVMDKDIKTYYDESGEYACSPNCYFLRNFKGQIKYVEPKDFEENFDIPCPQYPKQKED